MTGELCVTEPTIIAVLMTTLMIGLLLGWLVTK